ncbi:MAG: MBL fold metallo-hydrolase [Burkholderiales bacterium]|jgi:glyoxylase-like metal-dependent hydrolase (beta-lactamase superfamily II)|nr:MBL fold metallo-hydrolase [Burkholderiales bacterium]
MNKILKRVLIFVGVTVGVLVLAYGGFYLKIRSEVSTFTPMETGSIVDDVFVVKDDFANLFLVRDKDSGKYIVIDCAIDQASVAEQMKILGIDPGDVSAVFLTHTDWDHVGALSLFDNAKLYLSKEEEPLINGKRSRILFLKNAIPRTDYTLLEDRQVVQIGGLKVEAFLVPGHTPGMTAYLINNRYLFTGDILSLKDSKMAPIPPFFDMDTAQAIESSKIIRQIPTAEYLFTAHWGYTDDYKTAVE